MDCPDKFPSVFRVMEDYGNSLDYFVEQYKQGLQNAQTLFLLGANTDGIHIVEILSDALEDKDVYFIDRDPAKQGKEICHGILCHGFSKMFEYHSWDQVRIIITSPVENARFPSDECLLKEIYRELIKDKENIFLYGAGIDGIRFAHFLSDILDGKKVFFIDRDPAKQKREICCGFSCCGPEALPTSESEKEKSVILISSLTYAHEIRKTLAAWDNVLMPYFPHDVCLDRYSANMFHHYWKVGYYRQHQESMRRAFDFFKDDASQHVFSRILQGRLSEVEIYPDIVSLPQYFPDEIKKRLSCTEVFLDCGAYDGDSMEQFIQMTDNHFSAIYSFEMDQLNYRKLKNNPKCSDSRVTTMNIGISNQEREVRYRSFDSSSTYVIEEEQDPHSWGKVALKTIDDMVDRKEIRERITFVKMDIEGAEMDALQGMCNTLKRDRPKLAICVYHRPSDLWEIPIYIKSIVPEYTVILRHHHYLGLTWETVLYAYME